MTFVQNSDDSNEDDKSVKSKDKVPNSPYLKYRSMSLAFNMKRKKLVGTEVESTDKWKYFVFYIKSVSFFEVFFIRKYSFIQSAHNCSRIVFAYFHTLLYRSFGRRSTGQPVPRVPKYLNVGIHSDHGIGPHHIL